MASNAHKDVKGPSRSHCVRRCRATLFVVPAVLAWSGCTTNTVDLAAVQNFGKTTSAAAASFQEISLDYYASCMRYRDLRAETQLGAQALTAIPTYAPIVAMPAQEPSTRTAPTTNPAPAVATSLPTLLVGADDRDCKASRVLSDRWSLENRVLVGYVGALADVAGVGAAPDKSSFEAVGSALKDAGVSGSDKVAKAGGDLADAVVASLIRRRLEHDVAGLARDAAVPVQEVTGGLETAALAYRLAIRDEMAELNSNRANFISAETERLRTLRQEAGLPPNSPSDAAVTPSLSVLDAERAAAESPKATVRQRESLVAALRLRDRISRQRVAWSNDLADDARRANMAADYYRAVSVIRKAHDALLTTHGGIDAVVTTVKPFVNELSDPVNALIAASGSKR